NGTSIVGTSTPTVGTILATSTNATSTFAGGLSVSTLNVGSTTATSTFANGISLASGCFAVNGNCAGLFAYLFPNNATSTALAFNGGLTTTNSTSTNATSTNSFAAVALANNAYFGTVNATTTATSTFSGGLSLLNFA